MNQVLLLLIVWFLAALVLGMSGALDRGGPRAVAAAVWLLTLILAALTRYWPPLRAWIESASLRGLVLLHFARFFAGSAFLLLSARGLLAKAFAVPAGWGDIFVAVSALAVAGACVPIREQWQRRLFILWNLLGVADIVAVVMDALRVGLRDSQGMELLRVLPLSLLPTFVVPLVIVTHGWMLWRGRQSAGRAVAA